MVTELGCTVRSYAYRDGSLDFIEEVSTLPDDFREYNISAAIHISPDGKTLAVSNRGHESLAVFGLQGGT